MPSAQRSSGAPQPQLPPMQASRAEHFTPQPPQLASSADTSRHFPLHSSWPVAQPGSLQTPERQAWPVGHAAPHALQFFPSWVRSTQVPEQRVRPGSQVPRGSGWQRLATQA